jgi:peptidoglycan hydrolase-like protein with peptidoglycan-binding domain
MFLAGKVAWAGIVFMLLTTRVSGPRAVPLASEANLGKNAPAVWHQNEIKKVQETLRARGHYRGQVDGVFGLRTRASIRAYQKAENLPITGQVDAGTAAKLGVRPEGGEEAGYQTAKGKPSAYIEWAKGSRRTNRTLRKTVKTVTAPETSQADHQILQAENEKQNQ